MNLTLKVPSISCEVCATTITKAIKNLDDQAKIDIDIDHKIVKVESEQTEASIKETIVSAGHDIEE